MTASNNSVGSGWRANMLRLAMMNASVRDAVVPALLVQGAYQVAATRFSKPETAPSRSRILFVEDNSNDVMLVHWILRKARLEHMLMVVADAQQALKYLRRQEPYADRECFPFPSVVLLDLIMPGADGFEFLQGVRADPQLKRLPVTVFTGSNYPPDIDRAYALGANSVIIKPVSIEQFKAAVHGFADFWLHACRLPKIEEPHDPSNTEFQEPPGART